LVQIVKAARARFGYADFGELFTMRDLQKMPIG
jgi:hypothetical protein